MAAENDLTFITLPLHFEVCYMELTCALFKSILQNWRAMDYYIKKKLTKKLFKNVHMRHILNFSPFIINLNLYVS